MGSWGAGLYSDDFALDLKATVSTVCRLPMSGPEIVALLIELIAVAPDDEDYTTFWLVTADQLHKRGIASDATARAISIIDEGSDLQVQAELGLPEVELRKRDRKLQELRRRLTGPLPEARRRTIKGPQPFVVLPGEVYTFEVDSRGNPYNPYITDPAIARFEPVGWGAMMVVRAGHMLEYLAWYQIAPDLNPGLHRPTLEEATTKIDVSIANVGTLSRPHARRLGLQLLGCIEPPATEPPDDANILATVASDISASSIISRFWKPGTLR